jgi:hypothetical protein
MKRLCPVLLLLVAMCQSPESGRLTGGSGADVGNRAPDVELHGGSRMYSRTPCMIPRGQCPGPLPVSGLSTDFPPPR